MGRIFDLVFPQNMYCICCGDMTDSGRVHGLCDECIQKIDWSLENHFKSKIDEFAFDDVLSCCVYGVLPRTIIYKMKLQGQPYVARAVAKLLSERVLAYFDEAKRAGESASFDFLVPVPCTKKKELSRGFNQTVLLANFTSQELKIPVLKALTKLFDTRSARLSSGLERRFLQLGSFAVSPDCAELIKGRDLLLVDDVITTGSTADECARTLKEAGAKSVTVLCFASTAMA